MTSSNQRLRRIPNRLTPASEPRMQDRSLTDVYTFSFYDFADTPSPDTLDWHYHTALELILWPTVGGVRMVGDSISHFHRGDLCLIGSGTPHAFAVDTRIAGSARNIQVLFSPDCLGQHFLALPEMQSLKNLFERAGQGLVFHGKARQAAAERLQAIADEKSSAAQRFLRILSVLIDLANSRRIEALTTMRTAPPTDPRL